MSTAAISEMVVRLVRAWVYCYTSGLPNAVREARRTVIDSDLWEHQNHGVSKGCRPAEIAMEMLARFLMGIPADLLWRWEQRITAVSNRPANAGEGSEGMARAASQKWVLLVPMVLAILAIGVGIDNLVGKDENTLRDVLGSPVGAGLAGGFLPAGLLILGLAWSWRAPALGVAVTLGLAFLYWAALMTWVGLRSGWVAEGLVSLAGVAGAILYLTGLAVSRRSPQLGGALAIIGAIPMAVTLWWSLFMPILALLLGVFGLRRAQWLAGEQKPLS